MQGSDSFHGFIGAVTLSVPTTVNKADMFDFIMVSTFPNLTWICIIEQAYAHMATLISRYGYSDNTYNDLGD